MKERATPPRRASPSSAHASTGRRAGVCWKEGKEVTKGYFWHDARAIQGCYTFCCSWLRYAKCAVALREKQSMSTDSDRAS